MYRSRRILLTIATATLGAACGEPVVALDPPTPLTDGAVKFWEAGATVAWNEVARNLVVKYSTSPFASIRVYALLTVAQYNAVIAAEQGKDGSLHPSDGGAVAGASAAMLTYLYPAEAAFLEGLVDQQEASPGWPGSAHEDFASGETIGRGIAAGVIARAQTDRYFAPFTGTVPICPGCWLAVPTPPIFATLGQAKTFFLSSGDQFRPPPPPAFGSAAFLAALAEVRQISDTRTAEQTQIAQFWALPTGTITPLGYWNRLGADLAVQYHLGERETARALALMNMAGFDAIIASHEAKFFYWLIRPSQADPLITLPILMPSFPSYPSNHAAVSAAATTVLGAMFPNERPGLDAQADEAALSRLFGGIHYRFDCDAGLVLGRTIAAYVVAHDVAGHQPFVLP
jgi:membrane-associated phospholipid phosphatase